MTPVAWPLARLGEALTHLTQRAGLLASATSVLPPLPSVADGADPAAVTVWVAQQASHLGIETEAVYATYAEVTALLQSAAPALLWLPPTQEAGRQGDKGTRGQGDKERSLTNLSLSETEGGLLVLLKSAPSVYPRRVALLTPTLTVQWVAVATVCDWLCHPITASQRAALTPLLDRLGLQEPARRQTEQALLLQQLGNQQVVNGWLVRLSPGAPFWQQLRQAHIQRPLGQLLGSYLAQLGLTALTWWLLGSSALQGRFTWVGLWAWALLLFTALPLRMWTERAQQRVSEILSQVSKQRLLYGILRLQPEQIRHQGSGQFFGQVMEADSLDQLSLGGGLVAGLALLQVGLALALLALADPHWLLAALLVSWLLLMGGLTWLYHQRQRAWIASYRHLSSDLLERMVGHRTRLAQEAPSHWHELEDRLLAHYTDQARRLDQIKSWLIGSATRGWMLLAVGGLTVALAWSTAINLPLALAGILLALQALTSLSNGVVSLVNAASVWTQVRPLFQAASEPLQDRKTGGPYQGKQGDQETLSGQARQPGELVDTLVPLSGGAWAARPMTPGQPLVIARGIEFRYRVGGAAVIREGDLQIRQGERLLLAGPSGSGKSTLAALLAGLRTPSAGLLLLHGQDRQTLGTEWWRRRVMLTPQFHENHIFTGTLAFNLLLGRAWPPQPADLQEATALCQELGLGALIERMPAGLQQMVGESGWRLSHGERSRVYLARTLLQRAELMILDESFAALDPETLRTALACVLRHAPTLLVIAHP